MKVCKLQQGLTTCMIVISSTHRLCCATQWRQEWEVTCLFAYANFEPLLLDVCFIKARIAIRQLAPVLQLKAAPCG